MSHSTTRDQLSVLDFQYLVGTPDGIEHRVETHELALFTREEMLASFAAADFDEVTHDAEGMIGRGMYIARVDAG